MREAILGKAAFPNLVGQQYMSLTTYRKNGEGVATPVWFVEQEGRLYVYTGATAGKVKRIGHTSKVMVAPCTQTGEVLGEAAAGTARLLESEAERKMADDALTRKYGLMKRLFSMLGKLRGGQAAYIEIAAV